MSETEPAKPQIEGFEHELDKDRCVYVGQVPGEEFVYIQFTNGEATTNLKLSYEAGKALAELLRRISPRGLMSSAIATWVVVPKPISEKEEA